MSSKNEKVHKGIIFKVIYFSPTRFYCVTIFFRKIILSDGSFVFELYSGVCIDNVVVLFNSRICVREFSGHVHELIDRDKFSSLQVFFLFFFFFYFFYFLTEWDCWSPWASVSRHVHKYFRFCFFFSFIIILNSLSLMLTPPSSISWMIILTHAMRGFREIMYLCLKPLPTRKSITVVQFIC